MQGRNFGPKSGGYQFRRRARYVWDPRREGGDLNREEVFCYSAGESLELSEWGPGQSPGQNGFTVI